MTHPRRWLLVASVAAALCSVVTVRLVTADGEPRRTAGVDIAGGRDRAVVACASVDEVYRLVGDDAPAEDVFDAAEAAEREGNRARDLDPMWTYLADGAAALREGLRRDDARGTQFGRRLLDVECARLIAGAASAPGAASGARRLGRGAAAGR